MTVPVLSSSDPAHGAVDVYTNKSLTFLFANALDSATVTENTILLLDRTTNKRIPVTLTYDSVVYKVTMVLNGLLNENTPYRVILVGDDLKVTDSLSGADTGDDLTTSIVIEFATGNDQFQIDTTIGKEVDSNTLEGDLFLPSNVQALGLEFTVDKVRPRNYTHNSPVNLTGDKTVTFTFSKNLLITGAMVDWADIDIFPLVSDSYLGISGSLQASVPGDYSFPEVTLSVNGADFVVTLDKNLPNNAGLAINLNSNIRSDEGDIYGGGLEYSLNTELYPSVIPIRTIKRELRQVDGDNILDTYVGALEHKNTIWLWEKLGRSLDLDNLPWAAEKYIFYSTVLDIIEDQDYKKFLDSGTRRQLGDLNVSVDSLIGRLAMKIASARKAKDISFETLVKGWQFTSVIRSEGQIIELSRLWYDISNRYTNTSNKYLQLDIPASNTILNRRAKSNNPLF